MEHRYHRQEILPHIGAQGQARLRNSSVLVIGAGGLGCPCLQYLIGAGIGRIGIADGDQVEYSNLHRQTLFNEQNIGQNKATIAKQKLSAVNSQVVIDVWPENITTENVDTILSSFNLVIDCTDDFITRYIINDVCVLKHIPYIYAANYQYEGQLVVFENKHLDIQLRSLFPTHHS